MTYFSTINQSVYKLYYPDAYKAEGCGARIEIIANIHGRQSKNLYPADLIDYISGGMAHF